MKTDAELKRDLEAELAWDPEVKANAIGVAVQNGVVTVSGHLDTYPEKWAVERALNRVGGVKALALDLDVRLSHDHLRDDTEIARAAEHALHSHASLPPESVRVTVDKGWIMLSGEVDWAFQRRAAEEAVRNLIGVIGVSNKITLKYRATPAGIEQRIREALTRQAQREASHMDIRIDNGVVTLRGTVHSQHERAAAHGAAWAAPGVCGVVDELRLG
jgi:osmotically-inducible protein OsmY